MEGDGFPAQFLSLWSPLHFGVPLESELKRLTRQASVCTAGQYLLHGGYGMSSEGADVLSTPFARRSQKPHMPRERVMHTELEVVAIAAPVRRTLSAETSSPVSRTLALVLAGGRGTRLKQLTERRSKPTMFFGGEFRIIDFTLSNCVNSGVRRIGMITQYNAHSLLRHVRSSLGFLRAEMNEWVTLMPALTPLHGQQAYRGTADAVYRNLHYVRSSQADYVLVLAGDHIYKMDYSVMLDDHVKSGAQCTIGCAVVSRDEASGYGVMAVDTNHRILEFVEKPADPPGRPDNRDSCLVSMGIYVFNAQYLYRLLSEDAANPTSSHDFGRDIIPRIVATGCARAHSFSQSCVDAPSNTEGYWRDVGTIDAFWAANLEISSAEAVFDVDSARWPIWTHRLPLPDPQCLRGDRGEYASIVNTKLSGGSVVAGSTVSNSLLFPRVRVNACSRIDQAVLLPDVTIGHGCVLNKVVVDRGCRLPPGLVVGENPELDARRFERTANGVVLVTHEMLSRLNA